MPRIRATDEGGVTGGIHGRPFAGAFIEKVAGLRTKQPRQSGVGRWAQLVDPPLLVGGRGRYCHRDFLFRIGDDRGAG
jgi:hypothetical protein